MLKVDAEPIAPRLLNNRIVHSDYLRLTPEQAAILREVVEQGKSQNPLNNSLDHTCKYTKRIQELLILIRQTCPSINISCDKLVAVTPKNKDKRVRFTKPVTSSGNTNTKTASSSNLVFNKPMLSSTGVKTSTSASGSQPSGNTKKNKIQRPPSSTQKNKVEAHLRTVKSSLKNKNCTIEPKGHATLQHFKLNANSELICVKCNVKNSMKKVWKPTRMVFNKIGYIWRPTGRTFTIVENACPLTRITTTTDVPSKQPTTLETDTPKPIVTLVYSRKPRKSKTIDPVCKSKVVQIVLWYLDFGCSKHMTGDRSQLTNFVNKFLGTIKFGNVHMENTMSYGDHQIARHGLVRGLPKLKFKKDHLCFACAMGKSKKKPHKPKSEDTNQEKLYLLQMDLCGPMRVASVNGKNYILIIIDDYSRFTWTPVRRIRIDNGTELVNQTLREYYEKLDISHETSVARSSQQNFATACYTQNRSIIRLRHKKTPYELLHNKPLDLSFLHVFGALCNLTNDSKKLGKLQPKADIGIFIGYAPTKKAFRIYNKRTTRIIKTIHVDFDELTAMASEHSSLEPELHEMTHTIISLGIMPNPPSSTSFVPPSRTDWDLLFQPLFDELLTPPPSVDNPDPEVITPIAEVVALEPVASTGSPSSTTVDQDAQSPLKLHLKHILMLFLTTLKKIIMT
nr:hypothetical protein [Tanacetum cinerariifolium]